VTKINPLLGLTLAATLAAGACSGDEAEAGSLSGAVLVDGSSTVYPITEATAEEFRKQQARVRVTVGISGTGGGFKKFVLGKTDINDASRPIKQQEIETAASNDISFIEIPVAYDGIAVVANKQNDFLDSITIAQLRKIWQSGSTVSKWSDVDASWPDRPIKLYGPDVQSGTFDYFVETVNGKSGDCRSDYTASTDDNMLVNGVKGDANALGYFGFAYYYENQNDLKLIPVDSGKGPIAPSNDTINDGSYSPLSRPLFIYVRAQALENPSVTAFVDFYLQQAASLAQQVGYVALPSAVQDLAEKRLTNRITGTIFAPEVTATTLQQRLEQTSGN